MRSLLLNFENELLVILSSFIYFRKIPKVVVEGEGMQKREELLKWMWCGVKLASDGPETRMTEDEGCWAHSAVSWAKM